MKLQGRFGFSNKVTQYSQPREEFDAVVESMFRYIIGRLCFTHCVLMSRAHGEVLNLTTRAQANHALEMAQRAAHVRYEYQLACQLTEVLTYDLSGERVGQLQVISVRARKLRELMQLWTSALLNPPSKITCADTDPHTFATLVGLWQGLLDLAPIGFWKDGALLDFQYRWQTFDDRNMPMDWAITAMVDQLIHLQSREGHWLIEELQHIQIRLDAARHRFQRGLAFMCAGLAAAGSALVYLII